MLNYLWQLSIILKYEWDKMNIIPLEYIIWRFGVHIFLIEQQLKKMQVNHLYFNFQLCNQNSFISKLLRVKILF